MDKESLMLFAARASRVENQDAIDASIVGMLKDPKEVFSIFNFYFYNYKMRHLGRSDLPAKDSYFYKIFSSLENVLSHISILII